MSYFEIFFRLQFVVYLKAVLLLLFGESFSLHLRLFFQSLRDVIFATNQIFNFLFVLVSCFKFWLVKISKIGY